MQQNHSDMVSLSDKNNTFFSQNGFLIKEKYFSDSLIFDMKNEVSDYLENFEKNNTIEDEDFLYEDNSRTLRLIKNVHHNNEFFSRIVKSPDLLELVENLTGQKLVVLNSKINFKNGFTGGHFDWHQDSIYLGKKNSAAIAFIVAIDDITHENGPMMVIPKSHHYGIIDVPHRDNIRNDVTHLYPKTRTDNLPYSLPNDILSEVYDQNGITSFVGSAGTLFAMHCSTFHASGLNLTPKGRASLLIRYGFKDDRFSAASG